MECLWYPNCDWRTLTFKYGIGKLLFPDRKQGTRSSRRNPINYSQTVIFETSLIDLTPSKVVLT